MRKWLRLALAVICAGLVIGIGFYAIGRQANSFMGIQKTLTQPDHTAAEGHLTINGVEAPYDSATDCWYVPQSMDTPDWVGELGWSDGKEVEILDDGSLSDKAAAIAEGHVFTLKVGSDASRLVFTGMPAVVMHTESVEPVEGEKYGEIYLGGFHIFDPTGESGVEDNVVGITEYAILGADASWHWRGATSSTFPKRSWRVELHDELGENLNLPLLDLRDDDDWILMAMYNDDSKIRDKMSLDLWNEIAATNPDDAPGTHMRYVEVFLDGQYDGLYGLMEPLDQKSIPLNQETDYLYKSIDWYCPTNDEMFKIRAQTSRSFTLQWPRVYSTGADWQQLREYINIFYNDPGSINRDVMFGRISILNCIDYAMLVNVTTGVDNTFKNAYIWAESQEMKLGNMYVFKKVPWDMNYTWGETWTDQNANYTYFNPELSSTDLTPGDLWSLISKDYGTMAPMIAARWQELRETVFSDEALLGNMERQNAYVVESGAFARDTARWPGSGNDPDLTEMQDYYVERMKFLDRYYSKFGK